MPRSTSPMDGERPLRAAIYCRISADRIGAGLGVARQLEDCKRLSKDRGWSVVEVYEDNDTSAYSGRLRPGYQALLNAVIADDIDVVIAWHTDRLHRAPAELEEWIAACDPRGVGVVTVRAGDLDLSTAAGRMTARIVGAVARHESEQKAERIARKHRELALAGKPAGQMRAFGYNADGTVNANEAQVIREIVPRVLAGESIRSITRWLIATEVPTVKGGSWRTSTVRQMLTAARLSGQREWTPRKPPKGSGDSKPRRGYGMGEIVADAVWPAIIDKADTTRLRALLGDPGRRTLPRGRPVRYLLSGGVLRCGRCDGAMNSRSDPESGRRYACIKQPGTTKCGSMSVVADAVDRLVVAMLLDALPAIVLKPHPRPDARSILDPQETVDTVEALLRSLAEDYGRGTITRGEFLAARQPAEARLAEARLKQTGFMRSKVLDEIPSRPKALLRAWEEWPLERQRAVLTAVVEKVIVAPATYRGRPTFDPDRITPVWRV